MIHDKNHKNCRPTALTEYDGWTCHTRNLGVGCISPVLRVSHNSQSRWVLKYCVHHKSVGNSTVHVQAFDALAFVLNFADALIRGYRKCSRIFAEADFARFGSEDVSSFAVSVRLGVGKATELELMDRLGSRRFHGSPRCCFLCTPTEIGEGLHVSGLEICSKVI